MVRGCEVEFVKTPKQLHEPAWPRRDCHVGRRDLQVSDKGSSGVCHGGRGPVPQPYVHSAQEGRVLQTDFQSETVECVGVICSFQRFRWNQQLFQFVSLPFGLASSQEMEYLGFVIDSNHLSLHRRWPNSTRMCGGARSCDRLSE